MGTAFSIDHLNEKIMALLYFAAFIYFVCMAWVYLDRSEWILSDSEWQPFYPYSSGLFQNDTSTIHMGLLNGFLHNKII